GLSLRQLRAKRDELRDEYRRPERQPGELVERQAAMADELITLDAQISEARREGFRGGHFDEPNVLAHIRFNDRVGPKGEKILFIEELQSDWHQAGRKRGYKEPAPTARRDEAQREFQAFVVQLRNKYGLAFWGESRFHDGPDKARWEELQAAITPFKRYTPDEIVVRGREHDWIISTEDGRGSVVGKGVERTEQGAREYAARMFTRQAEEEADQQAARDEKGVPDAPFKTTWPELSMKRMLRYAAEGGYDTLAWTTGEQQVSRYDSALRKAVDRIEWTKTKDGVHLVGQKQTTDIPFNRDIKIDVDRPSGGGSRWHLSAAFALQNYPVNGYSNQQEALSAKASYLT
ncbi:hypothetical protein LCGC14_3100470, partial [marine sediment metagenome]